MNKRLDIYLNGRHGVKDAARSMATMWMELLPAAGEWGEAAVEFFWASVKVLWVIAAPFLFWLAPLIAIFTAHRVVPEEEIRARLRAGLHKNGPI